LRLVYLIVLMHSYHGASRPYVIVINSKLFSRIFELPGVYESQVLSLRLRSRSTTRVIQWVPAVKGIPLSGLKKIWQGRPYDSGMIVENLIY
jgi:hypothetical protein